MTRLEAFLLMGLVSELAYRLGRKVQHRQDTNALRTQMGLPPLPKQKWWLWGKTEAVVVRRVEEPETVASDDPEQEPEEMPVPSGQYL